jgi:hypothetical protein
MFGESRILMINQNDVFPTYVAVRRDLIGRFQSRSFSTCGEFLVRQVPDLPVTTSVV